MVSNNWPQLASYIQSDIHIPMSSWQMLNFGSCQQRTHALYIVLKETKVNKADESMIICVDWVGSCAEHLLLTHRPYYVVWHFLISGRCFQIPVALTVPVILSLHSIIVPILRVPLLSNGSLQGPATRLLRLPTALV